MSALRIVFVVTVLLAVALLAWRAWPTSDEVAGVGAAPLSRSAVEMVELPAIESAEVVALPEDSLSSRSEAPVEATLGPDAPEPAPLTKAELEKLERELTKQYHALVNSLATQHRERGEYDLKIVPEGETVHHSGTFPDGSQKVINVRTSTEKPGYMRLEIVAMRPSDYPELVTLTKERDRVAEQLAAFDPEKRGR